MSSHSGLFVTFEGGEGAGKTTLINKLAESLTQQKQKVVTTREPGGTEDAEKIRDLIVQREGGDWSPMAECLLLFAARQDHVEKQILPELKNGKTVLCDRFTDSTLAYQGYGRQMPLEDIKVLNTLVFGDFGPDLTFILDVDPEIGLERSGRRLAAESLNLKQTEDRFENLDLEFHKRLRQGFLDIAKEEADRCHVLDGHKPLDDLLEHMRKIVCDRLE